MASAASIRSFTIHFQPPFIQTSLHKTPRGFTLLELLVTVGIVALLIASLLPSLAAARNSSRATACLAQQRQIGVALVQQANDHAGFMQLAGYVTVA